jgi:hypothetical protein
VREIVGPYMTAANAALELAKHLQIHGVIVGNRFRISKINVIRCMLCDADES